MLATSIMSEEEVLATTVDHNPYPGRNARDIGRVVVKRPYGWTLGELVGDEFYSDCNPEYPGGEVVAVTEIARHDLRFTVPLA